MEYKTISASEAIKSFARRGIKVQHATPVTRKGEDGKDRPGFETTMKPLDESGVHGAKKFENGVVSITTIDGQRYRTDDKVEEKQAA